MNELYHRLLEASVNKYLYKISSHDWKIAPWVFSHESPNLLKNLDFRMAYNAFLQNASAGALRSLIHVYLRGFNNLEFTELAWIAQRIRVKLNQPVYGLLNTWWERDQEFHLFDPKDGPERFARACLVPQNNLDLTLKKAGLVGDLEQGEFAKAAFKKALNILRQNLEQGHGQVLLDRILEWSERPDSTLRYSTLKQVLVEALLLPFQTRSPLEPIKQQILRFLLRTLKDPRVFSANWYGISPEAITIMHRWLVGATLQQFFDLLDCNAQFYPEKDRQHWRYRRAFWWAYYQRGVLQEAWFAFAREAEKLARQGLDREQRIYGEVLDGSIKNHAVILMRIAGLTVVEWSHQGKCRIWLANDPKAPLLYQKQYTRTKLIAASERIVDSYQEPGITHFSSERGGWQDKVAEFIHRHTGTFVSANAYMPKTRV